MKLTIGDMLLWNLRSYRQDYENLICIIIIIIVFLIVTL
jgi:hypothetical protein